MLNVFSLWKKFSKRRQFFEHSLRQETKLYVRHYWCVGHQGMKKAVPVSRHGAMFGCVVSPVVP